MERRGLGNCAQARVSAFVRVSLCVCVCVSVSVSVCARGRKSVCAPPVYQHPCKNGGRLGRTEAERLARQPAQQERRGVGRVSCRTQDCARLGRHAVPRGAQAQTFRGARARLERREHAPSGAVHGQPAPRRLCQGPQPRSAARERRNVRARPHVARTRGSWPRAPHSPVAKSGVAQVGRGRARARKRTHAASEPAQDRCAVHECLLRSEALCCGPARIQQPALPRADLP